MSAVPGPLPEQFGRIRQALHPPGDPPTGPPWNLAELEGLLPDPARLVPAAVLMGLVPRAGGLNVLLTLRTSDLRQHAGQVSLPGGRIDDAADAGPLAAALREVREETGIVAAQVQPLGWLDPMATITGFRVLPLVARLAPDIAPVADPREVDEVFEVPLAHLLQPANLRRVPIEYRGRRRHVLEYLPHKGGARIWGATASILGNLMERLAAAELR
jgi:8-oxo-dGTP pyrophosphatase MutT (NUDIX family)